MKNKIEMLVIKIVFGFAITVLVIALCSKWTKANEETKAEEVSYETETSEIFTNEREETTTELEQMPDIPTVLNGFVTISKEQKMYYVNNQYVTGFKEIDNNRYYFDDSGIMVTGLKKIGKYYYYFDENGVMRTGFNTISGKRYYFNDNGEGIAKGWHKCSDGKIRYGLGKGKIATGPTKIGKTIYFLKAKKGTRHKKGFITYKKKEYYCIGKGRLATGYQALKHNGKLKGYYFSKKTGRMAKNKMIGYLKIPKSGRLSMAYALGIQRLNKNGWNLYSAYIYSKSLSYYGRLYRTINSETYSLRGFKEGYGNCYVMAATFYIQAKLLGYDAHQVSGYVGAAPHSWVTIRHKRISYVYDPDFAHETGRSGWKIYYGKPGTWRYNSYKNMN